MRKILYKAKRKDNGEWVEGFLFELFFDVIWCIGNKPLQPNDYSEIIGKNRDWFEIIPETICQYTGLTDKNGRKIYEGDIIKHLFREDTAIIKFGKYQNVFDSQECYHCGFYIDWKNQNTRKDLGYWIKMLEKPKIIGNVYDNYF